MIKLRNEHLPFIFWPIAIILFVISGVYVLMLASGYWFNLAAGKLEQTSLLDIKSDPSGAKIFLDNLNSYHTTPQTFRYVSPGWHNVRIERKDYQKWQKAIFLEAGKFLEIDNVVLFFPNPKPLAIKPGDGEVFTSLKPNPALLIKDQEIWLRDKLVARFSKSIKIALLYPDQRHIVYQVDNQIRAIDADGGADTPLVQLPSDSPAVFSFQDDGRIILIKQGNSLLKYQIR